MSEIVSQTTCRYIDPQTGRVCGAPLVVFQGGGRAKYCVEHRDLVYETRKVLYRRQQRQLEAYLKA